MKLYKIINIIFSWFGFIVIRISSLKKLEKGSLNIPEKDCLHSVSESSIPPIISALSQDINAIKYALDEFRKSVADNSISTLRAHISNRWAIVDDIDRVVGFDTSLQSCSLCEYKGDSSEFKIYESYCIFGGGRLTRYQCPNCDVIFGPHKMLRLSESELTSDYESHYKVFQEGDSTEQELRAFYLLNPSKEKKYLNFGAGGWSKSVQKLRSEGWNVFAFEPHDSAYSGQAHVISSKSELRKYKFDGIFSNNVLEHFRYPVQELLFMKSLLSDGGKLAHATPCFEYMYEYTRFHLFFYLGRSRYYLADNSGLRILRYVVDGEFMCAIYEVDQS